MGKLWENVLATTKEAFGCGAPDAVASLLQHPTPDARAAAVYALGALVFVSEDGDDQDVSHDEPGRRGGFGASASTAHGTDDGDKNTNAQFTFGDAERAAAERAVACHILPGVADASPVVRAETAIALGRLACAHSKRFRAAAEWYAALHMSPDYRNNRNNPNTLERRGSREFGGREGTAVMRALDEEGSLSFERGGAAGSANTDTFLAKRKRTERLRRRRGVTDLFTPVTGRGVAGTRLAFVSSVALFVDGQAVGKRFGNDERGVWVRRPRCGGVAVAAPHPRRPSRRGVRARRAGVCVGRRR